jgi:hypothetical protein
VCLSIGFGIAANDALALEWLWRSRRSQIELGQKLTRMAQWSQASEPWLYHTAYLNDLSNNGYHILLTGPELSVTFTENWAQCGQ